MATTISRGAIAAGAAALIMLSVIGADAAMPVGMSIAASHDSAIVQVAKKKRKMTPREEADKSYKEGTVPSRYRRDVPKQYQQYIPFSR